MKISIRKATIKDISQIKELFRNTILTVNSKDYSDGQVQSWAARGDDNRVWKERISTQYFIVALVEEKIIGFAGIMPNGYLHSLYVHADYQEKGVATILLNDIEKHTMKNNIQEITADISITARPFFEKNGYKLIRKQTVNIGIELINYKMSKAIH